MLADKEGDNLVLSGETNRKSSKVHGVQRQGWRPLFRLGMAGGLGSNGTALLARRVSLDLFAPSVKAVGINLMKGTQVIFGTIFEGEEFGSRDMKEMFGWRELEKTERDEAAKQRWI